MIFLRAADVRIRMHYKDRVEETSIYSTSEFEQKLHVHSKSKNDLERYEVVILYDSKKMAPAKISLSANQYTMNPFEIEISLYKRYSKKPYSKFKMEGLRTLFDIEEGTNRIILEFIKNVDDGQSADVKLILNYVKF